MKPSNPQHHEPTGQEISQVELAQPFESPPTVSIIVIARNEERTIGKCISSLSDQDYPNLNIIFVDSSSTDRTQAIVESYANNRRRISFTRSRANAAAARNAGLCLADAPIIAFVDGDSFFDENWLRRAVEYLQSGKEDHVAGVGGPFIEVPLEETTTTLAIFEVESTLLGGNGSTRIHRSGNPRSVKSLSLTGAIFWSDIVRRIGPFDERLEYCEDSEFCQRVRLEGYSLLSFGDLGAFHAPKYNTLRGFATKMWNYGVGRGRAIRRHWRLMNGVGLGAITYLIVLATLLFWGFVLGDPSSKLLTIFLGALYLGGISLFSLLNALRIGSVQSFFLCITAYFVLHVPYTIGIMVGIVAPKR